MSLSDAERGWKGEFQLIINARFTDFTRNETLCMCVYGHTIERDCARARARERESKVVCGSEVLAVLAACVCMDTL